MRDVTIWFDYFVGFNHLGLFGKRTTFLFFEKLKNNAVIFISIGYFCRIKYLITMIATILIEAINTITPELIELTEPIVQQAFVPSVIAAIGLAAQIGGSIYSQIKSSKANEEAKAEADKLKRQQDEMYRRQQSEAEMLKYSEGDFLNTAMGKGLVTEIQDQYKNAIKRGTANGLKRELTDEEKQANIQTANKQLTDSIRGVAQAGTGYRLGILNMVNQLKSGAYSNKSAADINMTNLNLGMLEGKNQSALNLGQNFNQVGTNLINTASSMDWDKMKKNTDQTNTNTNTKQNVWGMPDDTEGHNTKIIDGLNKKKERSPEELNFYNKHGIYYT